MSFRSKSQQRGWRRSAGVAIPLAMAASLLTVPAAANAVEPIAGGQTSGDVLFPNVGNSGYDAKHYDIDMAWTPGETLAEGSITATTKMKAVADAPLDSFSLDFEGLKIDSVKVNGEDAAFVRDIDADAIKYKLVVFPDEAVEGEFTTEISYHGVPSRHVDADGSYEGWNVTADGATFLGQPIGAMTGYPHNNTPADKATYRVKVDIPAEITNAAGAGDAAAVSIGNLVSSKYNEDRTRRTWDWRQTRPTASELMLISIGKYDMIQGQVTLSSGKVIPEWTFMDSALSDANKTRIKDRRAQLGPIIRNLEQVYGPYPGTSTGVVVDTVPSDINYALETQDRAFFPSANSVAGNTLLHELVHMWYGNAVSPKVWNDIWINEGMASWGPTHYNNTFAGSTATTENNYFNSWSSQGASSAVWTIPPAGMTDSATLYDYQTYTRGAQMWEALKQSIGDDAFFTFVKRWISDNRYESKGTEEFIALAEEISGKDLTDFFQDWIYDADKPAWVQKHSVSLTATPDAAAVKAGDKVTFTLKAENTGKVPLTSATVAVKLKSVLASATVDEAKLPEGLALSGDTLTWSVPETAATGDATTATVSFTAKVKRGPTAATLSATATPQTLGATCTTCEVSYKLTKSTFPKGAVTVNGTAKVGQTLKVKRSGFTSGVKVSYKWTANGKKVGKNSSSLKLTKKEAGKKVKVTITVSKPGYVTKSVTSKATAKVKKK